MAKRVSSSFVCFAFEASNYKPVSGIGYELIKIDSIHTFAS